LDRRAPTSRFRSPAIRGTPTGHLGAQRIDPIDQLNLLSLLPSIHTAYWSPLGNPTLAVPIGLSSDNTPLSMSISGRPFADADVLRAGDAYQRRTAHHILTPDRITTPEGAAMVLPTTLSASEDDENNAIEALSGFIRAMADLLHQTEDARYTDPSGGHVIDWPSTNTTRPI
jgi:hypothetical protein